MKIGIFSLGQKGYSVVKAISEIADDKIQLFVVVGKDPNIHTDFSIETTRLCQEKNIQHEIANTYSMTSQSCDLVFAAGWRWMIRDVPQERLIVFHDSLLPRYRGFAPLVNGLLNKETEVGVTSLYGGEKFDTGNIIAQQKLQIVYPTTINREIERISKLYGSLAVKVYGMMSESSVKPIGDIQNEKDATYSLWRDEDDYRIDWMRSSEDIAHLVSCVGYPYLGASTFVGSERYRIFEATILPDVKIENRSPGKVIFIENGRPIVVCGQGLLRLDKIGRDDGENVNNWSRIRTRFS